LFAANTCFFERIPVPFLIYATARKVSEKFKEKMKIVFDNYLGKWNYRAIPEGKN
jgi:hypothetical protein